MIKTLHWYIGRELLRVFLLTTGVLTTILAFGGTFRPLTKQGLGLLQLLKVLTDLMPAMLAYSIPLAALFAAVIVYWRLATDNELTGARASGASFGFLAVPALMLGLVVGIGDLGMVGYVVPAFLQKTSQALQTDLASLLLHNVGQRQPFQFGNMVVYADRAYPIAVPAADRPPAGITRQIIQLQGLAATPLTNGKPTAIVLARAANVIIDHVGRQLHVAVQLDKGVAYDPNSFRQIQGTIRYLPPDGKPYVIGSMLVNRPKFLDFGRLAALRRNPLLFDPIAALHRQLEQSLQIAAIARWYLVRFHPGSVTRFSRSGGGGDYITVQAPQAVASKNKRLLFSAMGNALVTIHVVQNSHVRMVYQARTAELELTAKSASSMVQGLPGNLRKTLLRGALRLKGSVRQLNPHLDRRFHSAPPVVVLGEIVVPPAAGVYSSPPALTNLSPSVIGLMKLIAAKEDHLRRQVVSEVQSRASFALSCVVLVILGAALGIVLQGRNPLAVFVVGFVPAMILVLLINTGRELVTRTAGSPMPGLLLIWAGNGFILLLNVWVYGRLLRR